MRMWFLCVFCFFAACSSESGIQDPSADLNPTEGFISGTIRDSEGRAIAGAEILVEPGGTHTISDGQGLYEVQVSVTEDQAAYTIAVAHEDFVSVAGAVTLTRSNPDVVFDAELPLRDEDPPFESLDIAQHTPPGPWGSNPTVDFMIDVHNQGPAALSNLVIVDTLDAEFGHEISLDDIAINDAEFPSATVTLGSDGRGFRIELGTLEPTQDTVRVFTLQAPTPQTEGVFCNRVLASGDAEGEPQTDIEIHCLATTLSNPD